MHKLLLLLLVAGAALVSPAPTSISDSEAYAQLDHILKDYDLRVRPGDSQKPVQVSVSCYILGIADVDRENRDITISMYLRHFWTDERLKVAKKLTLHSLENLWHPDTFVVNEKKIGVHDSPAENFIRIQPEGEVLWSQRITKKLSCPNSEVNGEMSCSMELESYGYNADEVLYALKEGEESFLFGTALEVPGISIAEVKPSVQIVSIPSGSYSRVHLEIKLQNTGVWH